MKTLIIYQSIHHHNTEKVAKVLAEGLKADIKKPSEIKPNDIDKYDLLGFGSGIYNDKHHQSIYNLIDKLNIKTNKLAFVFSTTGVPIKICGNKFLYKYTRKCNNLIKEKLLSKGIKTVDEFSCAGFNTNAFLKYIGGLNKNRPNEKDLKNAREFAIKMQKDLINQKK